MTRVSRSFRQGDLPRLIESDIRQRGLRAGDRYLTTHEAAAVLGIAKGTANKVMQELARRQVLVRSRKLGTFVGRAARTDAHASPLDVVHILLHRSYFISERSRIDQILGGLVEELGEASVQLTFVPEEHGSRYVDRLITAEQRRRMREAYIIGVKSPEIQAYFQDCDLPCVVLGTPYPGKRDLAWLDLDQREAGRLLIEHVLRRGRRRIAVFIRDQRALGDDHMLDEITAGVINAQLPAGALTVRSIPSNVELARTVVRQQFGDGRDPTAVICRSKTALNCLIGLQDDGIISPDLLLVSGGTLVEESLARRVAHLSPCVSITEEGRHLARLLRRTIEHPGEPARVMLPPRLLAPDVSRDG